MSTAKGVDETSLDSYSVRTYDKHIILAAHGDNGIMYSVYGLLNKILGYEYYGAIATTGNISDEVYTFKNVSGGSRAPLELLDFDDKPTFEQREVFLSQNGAYNPIYMTKLKLSTGSASSVLYGEGSGWLGSDRSIIEEFLPYFEYRDSYPIWYSDSNGTKSTTLNHLNWNKQVCFSALLFNYTNTRNSNYANFNNYCLLDKVDANGNYFDDANAFGKMMNNIIKQLKSKELVRSDVSTYTLSEIPRRIIFLGVEDNDNYCHCDACKQLVASYKDEAKGYDMGCYSDLMVRVANKVSQALKAWQNKLQVGEFTCEYLNDIGVFDKYDYKTEKLYASCWAYRDLLEAPHQVGVYSDDVIIRLASVRSSYYYPMNDERNTYVTEVENTNPIYGSLYLDQQRVNEELVKWQAMGAKRFAVWDYGCYVRGNIIPFPDWYSLQGNLQYYEELGVTEVITQLNGFENPDMKIRVDQPLHNLKMYLRSKLLWNPNEDVEKLTVDYFKHYYKHGNNDCSKEMLEYYRALQQAYDSLDKNATDEYYYRLKSGDVENNPLSSWDKKSTTGGWTGSNGYGSSLMNSFTSGENVYVNYVKMYAQNTLTIPTDTKSGLSGTKTFKEYIVACYNKAVTACNGDATLIARLKTEDAYINYLNLNC